MQRSCLIMKVETTDPVVQKVIKMLDERSTVGFKKYGVTLRDDDTRNFSGWIDMAIEEMLDQCNYLMKIKEEWENMNPWESAVVPVREVP